MEQEVGYHKLTIEASTGERRDLKAHSLITVAVVENENGDRYVSANSIFDGAHPSDVLGVYTVIQDMAERLRNDFPNLNEMYEALKDEGVQCVEVKHE